MKLIKRAISFVIYNPDRSKFIIVRRPSNDENLPNVWGLPAGSLNNAETFEDTVIRSAKEKLGVEISIVKLIGEGEIERSQYILRMKEFEVEIKAGVPKVPQPISGVTQYTEWKWGTSDDLIEAAGKGSLCSRLYLRSVNREW